MNELRRVDYPDPHRARTRALLRAHPEIKKLLGPTWWTPALTVLLVAAHLGLAALVSALPWWVAPLAAFAVGAFLSQALYAVLHECSHLLAGRGRALNRVVSLFANLPLLVPVAISYAHFHLMHHRHQGDPARDPDLPGAIEHGLARGGFVGKLLWQAGFPIWQVLRTRGMPAPRQKGWLAANVIVQAVFAVGLALWLGPSAIVYLALSLYFTMAMHPIAARLFQDDIGKPRGLETFAEFLGLFLAAVVLAEFAVDGADLLAQISPALGVREFGFDIVAQFLLQFGDVLLVADDALNLLEPGADVGLLQQLLFVGKFDAEIG